MQTIFDKLYDATDKALKKMSKPLVKKKIKRMIESAWDDAEGRKLTAEENLTNGRKDFDTYDINEVLKAKLGIKKCNEVQKELRKEFLELFDEEMKC